MACIKEWILFCDDCRNRYEAGELHGSKSELQAAARRDGWRLGGRGKEFCPTCLAEMSAYASAERGEGL
jgi:hypothetical protein